MTPRQRPTPHTPPTPDEPPVVVEPTGITYESLTVEMQKQILTERLQRLEAEHYSHSLNLQLAAGHLDGPAGREAAQQVAGVKASLVILESAHAVISDQLAALG